VTRIGIIGAGGFGTALGCALARGGLDVSLWGRNMDQIVRMAVEGVNREYLPDVPLPPRLRPTCQISDLTDISALLMAIPAQNLRGFLQEYDLGQIGCPLVLCAKGIESGSGMLQSQIAGDLRPGAPVSALTGPGFATEIAVGKPTALTMACEDPALGNRLQQTLSTPSLRLYLTDDLIGAQLGGALKNVIAIACGLVVGAGLGESARAALMTRGFAEMSRLATAMGARGDTLKGLSGFGDLALTCTSGMSRNFTFGRALGETGEFGTGKTVEGIATARSTQALAAQKAVDMPIASAVADVLEQKLTVAQALAALMSRPLKPET
jgi:glycerol-3-phosphate dehydrogenase (NAD(P)+)